MLKGQTKDSKATVSRESIKKCASFIKATSFKKQASQMKNEQTQQLNLNAPIEKKGKLKTRPVPKLKLNVSTWQKQSHGLFDYQSPPDKILKEELEIHQSSRVLRNIITRKTIVKELANDCKPLPQRIEIFQLAFTPDRKYYTLKNSLSTHLDQVMLAQQYQADNCVEKHKLFISLTAGHGKHQLAIGDFIKLGRVELVVLEINNAKKTQSVDFEVMYGAREYIFHMKEELEGSCKICLTDEATEQDPLVNPCNCKGSCAVIHLNCLKNWINNKVKKEFLLKVRTYNFEKFSCEICKAPFPTMIRLENGDQNFLLNFQRPTEPYILLEQCSQTEQKHAKTLHFIFPSEGQRVNIGRGQTCELNISDISVSRMHSYINFEKNHFCIHDMNSKFGTLIEVKKEIEIKSEVKLQHNGCSMLIGPKQQKRESRSKSGKKVQKKGEGEKKG